MCKVDFKEHFFDASKLSIVLVHYKFSEVK